MRPLRRWTRRYSSQRDEFHLSVLMRHPCTRQGNPLTSAFDAT
jgi:hypothetical protein